MRTLSPATLVHVVSLLVACVGFLVLLVGGVPELQPFPPGVIVLLVAAAAVLAMPRRRWVPLIGVVLCLAIAGGAFFVYPGTTERLTDPAQFPLWIGTVLQMGGVILAALAGIVAALPTKRRDLAGRDRAGESR
ncbi:hypothetical protein H7X46_15500 [Pseudonocardia sp. C8]|uniref:hypothetical protein n=1 Tax=Pseudonocardia sp. C8 TaxID=2762759 RepID=UPI0016429DA6|nr:hypothetical protein [Pseudonocardia sp. C8]MBC3192470.1 hypothetical protein [Pseudonocardia sp. C8]